MHVTISYQLNTFLSPYIAILISNSQLSTLVYFPAATKILLHNISFDNFWQIFHPETYPHLQVIEANFNENFCSIKRFLPNIHLINLHNLNLSSNFIKKLSDFAFLNLLKLKCLDLSNNYIKQITTKTLQGLASLNILQMKNNLLVKVELYSFANLNLKIIITNHVQVCCINYNPNTVCTAKFINNLPCEKLLPKMIFQLFGIGYGFFVILNNIAALFAKHNGALSIFNILTVTLHLSDLQIGLYILFLTVFNSIKNGRFVEVFTEWKHSALCQMISILTLSSILASCIIISFIALSRFLVIACPLIKYFNNGKVTFGIITSTLIIISFSYTVTISKNIKGMNLFSTPLCFPLGTVEPSGILNITTLVVSSLFLFIIMFSLLMYYLTFKLKNAFPVMVKSNRSKESMRIFIINMVLSSLSIGFYYITLSVLCFSSIILKPPPEYLQHYMVFIFIPINPVLNPLLYHLSPFKRFLLRNERKNTATYTWSEKH